MSSLRRILVGGELSVRKHMRFVDPEPLGPATSEPLRRDGDPPLRDNADAHIGLQRQPSSPFPLPSVFAGGGGSPGWGESSTWMASSPFASQEAQHLHQEEGGSTPETSEAPSTKLSPVLHKLCIFQVFIYLQTESHTETPLLSSEREAPRPSLSSLFPLIPFSLFYSEYDLQPGPQASHPGTSFPDSRCRFI
jgi:hypothetical protein